MKKSLHNNSKLIIFTAIFIIINSEIISQDHKKPPVNKQKEYSTEQAISYNAQLHTIAFSGLAFITGSFGADCFFPPGKVADMFGFQYMRDNDKNEKGHNTNFLTLIANNIIGILNDTQLKLFTELAHKQAPQYDEFAFKRMVIIKAFRQNLEGNLPAGKILLDKEKVADFCASLYELDGDISYSRAQTTGKIINSLTKSQIEYISGLDFSDSKTWPEVSEKLDKKNYSHREHVCIMTYASELFSWYAGSLKADVYFCPERHGTYFGGFYLKDFPAMGNPGYNISTSLTGDKGSEFLKILNTKQGEQLRNLVYEQKALLDSIVNIRTSIAAELRKAINGVEPDKELVKSLFKAYGKLDGTLSYAYACCLADIYKTLTTSQITELYSVRDLDVVPDGTFLFSDPVKLTLDLNTETLFK